LIRWGNSDRRVPRRELLPSREVRIQQEEEDSDLEEDPKPTDPRQDSETEEEEIIPEIRPRTRGPKWKKKAENIQEIHPRRITRSTKPTLNESDTEELRDEVWSEEETMGTKKNSKLTMPRVGGFIESWDLDGKRFTGKVIQVRTNMFEIRESTTEARKWIDLRRINTWEYINENEVGT